MCDASINRLGDLAAKTAMQAAASYSRQQNLTVGVDAVCESLAGAKEALDCGMDHVAEQTFAATMALAGIEAVKAVV